MTLERSQLRCDGRAIVYFSGSKDIETHELSRVSNIRVGRVISGASLVWALGCWILAAVIKWTVPVKWVGWLGVVVLAALSIVFIGATVYSSIRDTLSFDVGGKTFMYPLVDSAEEIDAFHKYVLAAVTELGRSRSDD